MNFNKFINSDYLKNNPLCGISTYKDELNLATGACTRQIKKLVLTGEENFVNQTVSGIILVSLTRPVGMPQYTSGIISSHFVKSSPASNVGEFYVGGSYINFNYDGINDVTTFKTYLQQQYSNDTPVCVWYVLATPTTETITVPSGLSGTEEGYLIQDSTPTPSNPIYPTANTVEKWFDIPHYIMGTSTDTITTLPAVVYANDNNATVGLKGDMVQSGTPSPTTPIQPQECGDLETTGEHTGQYKIPILSNSTTTPVYLGEVESTRQITKMVLDGTETGWEKLEGSTQANNYFRIKIGAYNYGISNYIICSHYTQTSITVSTINTGINISNPASQQATALAIRDASNFTDINSLKQYLADQYAAGTPVTVWYVLAEPTTGIVNEPLRKIGTYADEVSGITIPTIAGANTVDVDTTLQPSEVSVNYHGWHPVADVHERENGAWT